MKDEKIISKTNSTYEKPLISRIDLALDETLSAGCKTTGDLDCSDPLGGGNLLGS